ncbi:MAG: SRPBCC family protein [Cyclobacteriaceae bacterium]
MKDPGQVHKEKDGFKVIFRRILNHPIEKIWEAITDPNKLKVWFTDFTMELRENSDLKIRFRDEAGTVTTGKVLEVKPPHRLAWTWEGKLAEWDLEETAPGKCRLIFTYSKLSDKYIVDSTGGFHTLIERLTAYLEGDRTTYPFGTEGRDPRQEALREAYAKVVYDDYPELEQYHPVHLEKEVNASPEKVWQALTDNEQLKQWCFDFEGAFSAQEGHEFTWTAGPPEGKQWLHGGKILEVVPEKKLVHSWEYPGYKGRAVLTWLLEELAEGRTLVKAHFDITKPFAPDEDALRRKNFVEGWEHILHTSLPEYLTGV